MSRTSRLLELLQLLRAHRAPVSAASLATLTGVSLRTLYRDIETLRAQGAPLAGEAGVGYVLQPGFLLPPLMFRQDEIEALVLGARMVGDRTDHSLGMAARSAMAKIESVLPPALKDDLRSVSLLLGPTDRPEPSAFMVVIRDTIRRERKLRIAYSDAEGSATERVVWPFALVFFERVQILVAWCEVRMAIRHFRLDRIARLEELEARYPRRRAALLKEWRESEGVCERAY